MDFCCTMLKKILFTLISGALISTISLAQFKDLEANKPKKMNEKYTSAIGYEYEFLKIGKGMKPEIGDICMFYYILFNHEDSAISGNIILDENKKVKSLQEPVFLNADEPTFPGDLREAIRNFNVGDSGYIYVKADEMLKRAKLPPFIKEGTTLKYVLKLEKILNEDEYNKLMIMKGEEQLRKEEEAIKKYALEKNLQPIEKLEGGLYYYKTFESGDTSKPQKGQTVTVHYTGYLINGTKFDSSKDRNQPFSFKLGVGQVINGWDLGVAELSKGDKATLLIPSYMGYGTQGAGAVIPPNATLIFEVELIDFK